jgi:dolichyl-phosphate-mannose-protein mannosyltransferase
LDNLQTSLRNVQEPKVIAFGNRAGANAARVANVGFVQLAAVLLVGLIVRIGFIQSAGYRDDMTIFYDWFRSIAVLPPSQVYAHMPGINYPPAYILIIEWSAMVMRWFVHGTPSEYALNVALKLPAILFDIAGAALTYFIVRRQATNALGLVAAAFIALNPAIIYDSAYWGQDDSIPTVIAIYAISALSLGNPVAAWLALTFAVLFKPPVLVLFPLLLLYPFVVPAAQRRMRLAQTGIGIVAAAVLTLTLAVMFFPHPSLPAALRHLVSQVVNGSRLFPLNSLNAFNSWAIFQPFFVPDSERFLGLSIHRWGDLIFTVLAAVIYWGYAKRRDAAALFEATLLLLLAFFLFLTQMHERYLCYAVVFIGTLVFKKPYGYAALILSLTFVLNLEYGLTFMYLDDAKAMMINRFEFAPWLVHLCSVANLAVFGWLLADFFGLRRIGNVVPTAEPSIGRVERRAGGAGRRSTRLTRGSRT